MSTACIKHSCHAEVHHIFGLASKAFLVLQHNDSTHNHIYSHVTPLFVHKQQVTHTRPVCKQSYTQHTTEQYSCCFHTCYQSHCSNTSRCLIWATEISAFHDPTYITSVGSHAWQRPHWLAQVTIIMKDVQSESLSHKNWNTSQQPEM
jgi:hypothetical protein